MNKSFNHRSKATLIGITTISTLLMFYFGFNYLKGVNVFSKSVTYYATFDNVRGVDRSTNVYVGGFRVGNVRKIIFDYEHLRGAVVELALDASLRIPKGSKLMVRNNPLGGGSIVLLPPQQTNGILAPKDTLLGEQSVDMLAKLSEEVIPNLNTAIISLDTLLSGLNGLIKNPNIPQTLSQLNSATSALQRSSIKLDQMLGGQVPQILNSVERSADAVEKVTGQVANADVEKILTEFTKVVSDLRKVSGQMNSEESTLGLLLNDKGLYQKLDAAVLSADSLLSDIKKNPKRYVRFSLF